MRVYLITNTINGKQYIGQTAQSVEQRWQAHCYNASGNHLRSQYPLYCAIRKYGKKAFSIAVLAKAKNQEELNQLECDFIEAYGTMQKDLGYNRHPGGNKPPLSTSASREKAAQSNRGQKRSEESKKRISLAHIGKTVSIETRQKISESKIGFQHSLATRQQMSLKRRGVPHTSEWSAKIAAALIGKHHSDETKEKSAETKRILLNLLGNDCGYRISVKRHR